MLRRSGGFKERTRRASSPSPAAETGARRGIAASSSRAKHLGRIKGGLLFAATSHVPWATLLADLSCAARAPPTTTNSHTLRETGLPSASLRLSDVSARTQTRSPLSRLSPWQRRMRARFAPRSCASRLFSSSRAARAICLVHFLRDAGRISRNLSFLLHRCTVDVWEGSR